MTSKTWGLKTRKQRSHTEKSKMATTTMSSQQEGRKRKICLFGTSANPPTGNGGHVSIVQALSALQAYDEVRVLPVYQHSFQSKRNQSGVSYEHRFRMSQIAFEDVPKATVSDGIDLPVSESEEGC